MTQFLIEKGLPIPEMLKKGRPLAGCNGLYPFAQMEVGDSFLVPFSPSRTSNPDVYSPLSHYMRRHPGKNFTCRKVDGGLRVWRIA